jgi:hypothetical protein
VEGTHSTDRACLRGAIAGRGFDWFRCRGRRGGRFGSGYRCLGGRAPAAVGTLPPTRWGLSLVPPAVGAEPPRRSLTDHRHLRCTSSRRGASASGPGASGAVTRPRPRTLTWGRPRRSEGARSVAHNEHSPRPPTPCTDSRRRHRSPCPEGYAPPDPLPRRSAVTRPAACPAVGAADCRPAGESARPPLAGGEGLALTRPRASGWRWPAASRGRASIGPVLELTP